MVDGQLQIFLPHMHNWRTAFGVHFVLLISFLNEKDLPVLLLHRSLESLKKTLGSLIYIIKELEEELLKIRSEVRNFQLIEK